MTAAATGTGRDRTWWAVVLPLLLVALIFLVDVVEGPKTAFVGVLVAAPMLSAVLGRPRTVLAVGLTTLVTAAVFGYVAEDGQVAAQTLRLAIIAGFTGVAVAVSAERVRSEVRLARADRIVSAVTEAIIRPLPPAVGGVGVASRYLGADAEAHVGGDFYEVLETTAGVRVLLGDVRGKGLSAVRMANYVLGAFRDAARREARLEDVAAALDVMVSTEGEPEDFVTALLLEVRGDEVRGVSCGHPQPQLAGPAGFEEADLPVDVPLGLGAGGVPALALPRSATAMLLHSDGLTEARPAGGQFMDLDDVLASLRGLQGEHLLDAVVAAVRDHVGGRLRDDVALLWVDASDVLGGPRRGAGPGVAAEEPQRDLGVARR